MVYRLIPRLVILAAVAAGSASCSLSHDPKASGEEPSILASIGGMDSDSSAIPNLTYTLLCTAGSAGPQTSPSLSAPPASANQAAVSPSPSPMPTPSPAQPVSVVGTVVNANANAQLVQFKSAAIKDGDSCSMQVSGDNLNKTTPNQYDYYSWFSADKALYYGSTKAAVSKGALSLTLYKLYVKKTTAMFTANVRVKFDGDAALPSFSPLHALLLCGKATGVTNTLTPGASANEGVLTFGFLDLTAFRGVSCTDVVVMNDTTAAYKGTFTAVQQLNPVAATDNISLSEEIVLKKIVDPQSVINVTTTGGEPCVNFDRATGLCMDNKQKATQPSSQQSTVNNQAANSGSSQQSAGSASNEDDTGND